MKLIGKVPVEPLDDERLTNIERNLVVAVSDMRAPAPHSRRGLAFAAIAMAIVLAGFAGWKLHKAPAAEVKPQTFAMKSETEGSTLDLGDAQLASMPGTDVRVERTATRTSIELSRGNLDLTVEHKPGRLLVVRAGDTEIEDVGTKFSVVFDGKSHVEVRVTEGEVKVRRAAKDVAVTASNAWTTELGSTTIAQLDAAAVDVVAGANVAANDVGANDVGANDVGANGVGANNVGANNVGANNVGATGTDMDAVLDNRSGAVIDNRGSASIANPGNGNGNGSNNGNGSSNGNGNGSSNGSDNGNGNGNGNGSGSATGRHKKPGQTNVTKAILAVPLNPLPGTMADYNAQLNSTARDKSRVMYSIAVAQHLAKNDTGALHSIEGNVKQRTTDEAYKDSMWLQVRIRCLKALDDNCRIAAQRYINAIDAGNIPSGPAGGVAQAILKEIAL